MRRAIALRCGMRAPRSVVVLVFALGCGGGAAGQDAARDGVLVTDDGGGSLTALHGTGAIETFMARPPLEILRDVWPWLTALGVVGALFSAIVQAVFFAPWVVIHRALTRET